MGGVDIEGLACSVEALGELGARSDQGQAQAIAVDETHEVEQGLDPDGIPLLEELGIDGAHLRLDHVGLIDTSLHSQVRQVGEEAGIGVAHDGDDTHGSILDEGHGERIIA